MGRERPQWQYSLNVVAFSGWCMALGMVLRQWPDVNAKPSSPLMILTLCVEMICVFEVCQIALGLARGNLVLGVILHYVRLMTIIFVLPGVSTHLASRLTLLAWAITEVMRYPMFLFPSSRTARLVRFVTPIITFPIGAGAEAWAAYLSLVHVSHPFLTRFAIALIVSTNVIGGWFWAMPALLKKAGFTIGWYYAHVFHVNFINSNRLYNRKSYSPCFKEVGGS